MKIFNTKVYGLEESVIRSGYPMQTEVIEWKTEEEKHELFIKSLERMKKLGNAAPNSGHDCAVKGIVVQVDIQAPQHFWLQFERYHFQDTISSQSTMHRIAKIDLKSICTKYVDDRIINICNELIEKYNQTKDKENFYRVIDNLPEGLQLTRGLTLNYLQLKTMYMQREYHKMYTWNIFCDWCESLPYFKEFCLERNK